MPSFNNYQVMSNPSPQFFYLIYSQLLCMLKKSHALYHLISKYFNRPRAERVFSFVPFISLGFFHHIYIWLPFFKWHSVKDISLPSNFGVSTSLPLKPLQGPSSGCPSRGDQRIHTEKCTNNVKSFLNGPVGGPSLGCLYPPSFLPWTIELKNFLKM